MKRDPPYPKNKNFYLCGLHFRDDSFKCDLRYELQGGEKTFKLLDTAVPSIFSFSKETKRWVKSQERAKKRKKRDIIDSACTSHAIPSNDSVAIEEMERIVTIDENESIKKNGFYRYPN